MKEFSLEEFLRYIVIGIFFILVNICIITTPCENRFLVWVGQANIPSLLLGLSVLLGVLIYTIYRSFVYQLIINPIVIYLNKKILNKPDGMSGHVFIRKTDLRRMDIQNLHVKKYLSEWASQVHLLYNFSLSLVYTYILSLIFSDFYVSTKWILFFSIIFLWIGYLYHKRYKIFEQEALDKYCISS
jgi:hypothetical protein